MKTTTGTTGTATVVKGRKPHKSQSTGDKIVSNLKKIPKATTDFFKKLNIFGSK